MKSLWNIRGWSERHQVVAILAATAVMIVVLWVAVLGPLNLARRRLEAEITAMRRQLAEKNFLIGEEALRERQRTEIERGHFQMREWNEAVRRTALTEPSAEGEARHIDFKVALYEARFRMNRKARELGLSLPPTLGMQETVPSGEDARKLLYQLRALERTVDLLLDLKAGAIQALEPLAPIRHSLSKPATTFLEEYPVRVQFDTDITKLDEWLRALIGRDPAFALRHFRIDGVPKGAPSTLRVTAVVSGLVYPNPTERLMGGLPERVLYTEPLGH